MRHLLVYHVDYDPITLFIFNHKRRSYSSLTLYLSCLVFQAPVIDELLDDFLEVAVELNGVVGVETLELAQTQEGQLVKSVRVKGFRFGRGCDGR